MTEDLINSIVQLERSRTIEIITERLAQGDDPMALLDECRQGLTAVGEKFQSGEYFLAELMLVAGIFKKAAEALTPHLMKNQAVQSKGKIVLATMRGDIHDLGKNILAALLSAYGFEVIDLGVDVQPQRILDEVQACRPDFVGFSALITTTYAAMKEAADLLVKAGLRGDLKLLIGGGMTTPALKEYIGADFQCTDAMAGVSYCLEHARTMEVQRG